jgi:putative ABC transport system permease protein
MTTGVLHTKFKINGLLSGILVMTALYSVNLHVMGRSNVPLLERVHAGEQAESLGMKCFNASADLDVSLDRGRARRRHAARHAGPGLLLGLERSICFSGPTLERHACLPATTPNESAPSAVSVDFIIILGLALSNGPHRACWLAARLSTGALPTCRWVIGMVVWGLASVIIGEALVGGAGVGLLITGAVIGSVLFRLLVAIALRWGLNPNDLKAHHCGVRFCRTRRAGAAAQT